MSAEAVLHRPTGARPVELKLWKKWIPVQYAVVKRFSALK